ncbi:MAG: glutamine synthetase [Methylotenera sp.]|nr:glutamine synthetase [Methylotenera sp.]
MSTLKHVAEIIKKHNITEVECVFPTINATLRGKVMRGADFSNGKELRIARAVILQTINGEYCDEHVIGATDNDTILKPDYSTFKQLPWQPQRAWVLHDCMNFDGSPSAHAPRNVLKNILAQYETLGLTPVVAPEIEFYLFKRDGQEATGFTQPTMRGGSIEQERQMAYSLNATADMRDFWQALQAAFDTLEIRTDTWLHEMAPNQFEINLLHGDALKLADDVVLFKHTLREIAAQYGLNAVFMAKPLANYDGSSMHLHQSIVDKQGNNLFSDQNGAATPNFYSYIAGLQAYMADLMPFMAPYFNSWRRYARGTQAPINLQWGHDNRTIGLRVPHANAAARRVENRFAGSDANPYLAIAATLACGLRGMQEKLQPTAPNDDKDGYDYPRQIAIGLESALTQLKQSQHARTLFGDAFIEAFINVKEIELAHFMFEVSSWDRRYLALQV